MQDLTNKDLNFLMSLNYTKVDFCQDKPSKINKKMWFRNKILLNNTINVVFNDLVHFIYLKIEEKDVVWLPTKLTTYSSKIFYVRSTSHIF